MNREIAKLAMYWIVKEHCWQTMQQVPAFRSQAEKKKKNSFSAVRIEISDLSFMIWELVLENKIITWEKSLNK